MGGKASVKTNKAFRYWFSDEGRKKRASMGGKSHKGKRAMYKPGENSFHRIPQHKCHEYLSKGYVFGSPLKPNLGKTHISTQRKKVTDGIVIYDSVMKAAEKIGLTPSAVIYRLKSPHFSSWKYFYDTEY